MQSKNTNAAYMVQRMWKQEQDQWGLSARGWIPEEILEDLNHFICQRD